MYSIINLPSTFAVDYTLRSSWIIDPGSSIHLCNDTMKRRYTVEKKCSTSDKIAAGNTLLQVESIGRVTVNLNSPSGKKTIILTNVHTSQIS